MNNTQIYKRFLDLQINFFIVFKKSFRRFVGMKEIQELLLSNDHEKISQAIILLKGLNGRYWLREYANALLLLPTGYKSWTHFYSECMEKVGESEIFGRLVNIPFEDANENAYTIVERFSITISELHRNVANEVLFFKTFMDWGRLDKAKSALNIKTRMFEQEIDEIGKASARFMDLINYGNPNFS